MSEPNIVGCLSGVIKAVAMFHKKGVDFLAHGDVNELALFKSAISDMYIVK